jgi:cysteine synthase A
MSGAIAKAEEIAASNPGRYVLLQQFKNPANPAIHEATTGPEIWHDTDGGIDILVSGVGTGGTITGVSRYIKQHKGKAIHLGRCRAGPQSGADPEACRRASQAGPAQDSRHRCRLCPRCSGSVAGGSIEQVTNDEAVTYARRLAREEGILAGISCGAAVAVAARLAHRPENAGKTLVVILPDSGERYLSSILFEGLFDERGLAK